MNEPSVTTDGDSWVYNYQDFGMSIGFEQLYESGHELHGHLYVFADAHQNGGSSHISWGSFNLSSTVTRQRQAESLAKRTIRLKIMAGDWAEMLEYACITTAMDYYKGEPGVNLAEGQPILDAPYLIKNFIAEKQPTVLYADGESAKGWVALGLALSLRLGGEVIPGLIPTKQVDTVYLDWEDDDNNLKRRHRYICNGLAIHALPDIHYQRQTAPLIEVIARVREYIRKTRSEFCIIDSIGMAAGGDIRDSETATKLMGAVRKLGVTTLLLGHITKAAASNKDEPARIIGSTFYHLLARSCWEMSTDSERQPIIAGFHHRKNNLGPRQPSFALRLEWDDQMHRMRFIKCALHESPVVVAKLPLAQRMVAVLHPDRQLATSALAKELGATSTLVRYTGRRLEAENPPKVVQVASQLGRGGHGTETVWGLPDPNGKAGRLSDRA